MSEDNPSIRHFIYISYLGTRYKGWQKQPKSHGETVQGCIEEGLSCLLRRRVEILGSGRTDAG
ncbi:MAG: tRNA pseudouridine(38-40) synthase TruA, partial [Cytophagales bacterium]|nr:tRNA pseudouridine(38-40) synthase TruA [Cytophagales bacterium]